MGKYTEELKHIIARKMGKGMTRDQAFALPLMVNGDKEFLIPMVGRVTFSESPLPALRKAIDAEWKSMDSDGGKE